MAISKIRPDEFDVKKAGGLVALRSGKIKIGIVYIPIGIVYNQDIYKRSSHLKYPHSIVFFSPQR